MKNINLGYACINVTLQEEEKALFKYIQDFDC